MKGGDFRPIHQIKALVTDIDGSITDSSRRVSLDAVSALRELEDQGIMVMLASGNVLPVAYGLANFIGATGPVIAENGGIIYYKRNVKLLGNRKKSDEAFLELRKHLPVKKIFSDRWREAELAIEPDVDIDKVRKLIAPFGLLVESTGFAYHIFEPSMGKLLGLEVACEMVGISTSDVAAFGDSENDLKMISHCAIGMVPSNAQEALKSEADFIAQSPNGKGLLEALRWLGLLKEGLNSFTSC